jgi:hypothetical protein
MSMAEPPASDLQISTVVINKLSVGAFPAANRHRRFKMNENKENRPAESFRKRSPYGKVMGVVETHEQLQRLTNALAAMDIKNVRVLQGKDGERFLKREEDVTDYFVLGDVEPEAVYRYLEAVKNGYIAFAVSVNPDAADRVAEMAKAEGANNLVHFGEWVITNY